MINLATPSRELLNSFKNQDVLDIAQFSREELEAILYAAYCYEERMAHGKHIRDMEIKIMASLFFEPSTRTRLSFEAAMMRLGGQVFTVTESLDAQTSSIAKGETMYDTIKVVDNYADIVVCRSPLKDSRFEIAQASEKPVINAGDGGSQHPTQAILDMFTIFKEKDTPDNLTIALVGDLKNGRTVHSLADALSMYKVKLILVSPERLPMPEENMIRLHEKGVEVEEVNDLNYAVKNSDIIYMTRVQRERFVDLEKYEKVKDMFILTEEHRSLFKKGAIIMHPLPRVNEIVVELDSYEGAAYFRQAANGLPTRMALLSLLTGSFK
ncbi:MAG: aspartate carbamoyltransferase [Bacillota bacterium]|jgi:aspartate carbamoyltransferase catalytic subunit